MWCLKMVSHGTVTTDGPSCGLHLLGDGHGLLDRGLHHLALKHGLMTLPQGRGDQDTAGASALGIPSQGALRIAEEPANQFDKETQQ
jgi:hypothetical protein